MERCLRVEFEYKWIELHRSSRYNPGVETVVSSFTIIVVCSNTFPEEGPSLNWQNAACYPGVTDIYNASVRMSLLARSSKASNMERNGKDMTRRKK
ncbi:hypothetical protein DPMN_108821 [Dreissena polymorpha]|uniref:Uncharacterized protein n=1 Tax=Dreissena polymorpha TaxID=45954 RepID=A0A9D4K9I3_DREPO|nr:hypothetical protein DPMN_108821 [Dreissena polymorpha]